ncbi:oligosaccharide flippase family protein [Emticicia sp. ODNR4P]|nr:oligosaccharide flippase family protein [Emticicia sp. ODNR4P]
MKLFATIRNTFHEYRGVIHNFVALAFLQATNLLIPLLLIPLLLQHIGLAQYGIVALAQSTMLYFYVWVDYGFSLSAVKTLSEKHRQKEDLGQLFYEVSLSKIILLILGFGILLVIIPLHPAFTHNTKLIIGSYMMVVGQALLPIWFFQGVEKMPWATYANFCSKILSVCLIYFWVKGASEAIWVNVILGGSNVLVGVIANIYLSKKYHLVFQKQWLKGIPRQLKEGFFYFTSHFSVSLYMHSGIILLGWFVNEQMLGVYSIAEKIALLLRQVLVMFSQAIYTQLCHIITQGYEAMQSFLRKLFFPFCILVGLGCLGCWLGAPLISTLVKLDFSQKSLFVQLVRYMAFIPVIVCVNIPFYQLLLISDHGKSSTKILSWGALVCILLNVLLIPYFSVLGTALALLVTESMISVLVILKAKKYFFRR